MPAGFTYTTTGMLRTGATEMTVSYLIGVAPGTSAGTYQFSITYDLFDGASQPLGPLTGNTFNFTIQVTP